MKNVFWVFLGGGLGSVLRYLLYKFTQPIQQNFPYATLLANVFSCLILGFVLGFLTTNEKDSYLRLLLITGFCGGFSTYSAFAYESNLLLTSQQFGSLIVNIVLNFTLSIAAIYLGSLLSKTFI